MSTAPLPQQPDRNADDNPGLLDKLAATVRPADATYPSFRRREVVTEFLSQVLAGEMMVSRSVESMISARIAQIDDLVSRQLNSIFHAPEFRTLEASWRGLDYLVRRTARLDSVKIRVLNASKKEIVRDFNYASELRTSAVASQVWDKALETYGGEPFTTLISNFSFGPGPEDQVLLERFRRLGSWAHVPFIGTAAPKFLGVNSFATIPPEFALQRLFDSPECFRWTSSRTRADAAYVALALPSVLMRRAYSKETCAKWENYCFEEQYDERALPWGSPVWALAAQLARCFSDTSWCAELHARQDSAIIRKLPSFLEYAGEGQVVRRGPTDSLMSDGSRAALTRLGFIPLCAGSEDGRAAFFETPTMHKRPAGDPFDENPVPPPPLDRLEFVLASSRVAQYVKCIVREKQSSWKSVAEAEKYLNDWAADYTVPEDASPGSPEAHRPFLAASFRVVPHTRLYYNYRVEGEILPNLQQAAGESPVPVSVHIALPSTLPMTREPAPQLTRALPELEPASSAPDHFASAAGSLEQIAELHRKQLIDDAEFRQLHDLALARMKKSFASTPYPESTKPPLDPPVPFAALHAQIVQRVAESYQSDEDVRYRAYRAVAEMAERQALAPGDSEPLSKLIDATLSSNPPGPRTSASDELDRRLAEVRSISATIAAREGASPAARAIAETTGQSVERANDHIRSDKTLTQSNSLLERTWRKLVWPDVEGAFSGGAAAASAAPAFSSSLGNVPMSIVAALGVVIGAGIRSGVAYGESYQRNRKPQVASQS